LRLVEEARARGVDVTIDQVSYTASSTGTAALFPQWRSPAARSLWRRGCMTPPRRPHQASHRVQHPRHRGGGEPERTWIDGGVPLRPVAAGKSLARIHRRARPGAHRGKRRRNRHGIQEKGGCQAVYHAIAEADVVEPDPALPVYHDRLGRARSAVRQGRAASPQLRTFARVLGRYVRELHVLTLERCGAPHDRHSGGRLGLDDRGLLRPA